MFERMPSIVRTLTTREAERKESAHGKGKAL
jgi:hypothetical protein